MGTLFYLLFIIYYLFYYLLFILLFIIYFIIYYLFYYLLFILFIYYLFRDRLRMKGLLLSHLAAGLESYQYYNTA
jgi:hypothetical protein